MKKLMLLGLAALTFTATAYAAGGGDIVFENAAVGNITFSHDNHAAKGLACTDCHTAIFPMKAHETKITMADINAGKVCGTCHKADGKAFAATDCAKCHKK